MNPITSAKPHSISIKEIEAKTAKARGLTPLKLETDLLLKRVKQGGRSGDFLAQAFLSTYSHDNFNCSLGDIVHLDAEGFRVFHQVLHIKIVKGWRDDALNDIANKIKILIH